MTVQSADTPTETLTPSSEVVTVPEHTHPHAHDDQYAPREHSHYDASFDSALEQIRERLDRLETPPESPAMETVEVVAAPEPEPEVKPAPRGLRRYVRLK